MFKPLALLILISFIGGPILAADKTETEHLVICRNAKAVRTLRIEKKSNLRCQTYYTKAGVDQSIGSSVNLDSCMSYLNRVRGTLEKASWNC